MQKIKHQWHMFGYLLTLRLVGSGLKVGANLWPLTENMNSVHVFFNIIVFDVCLLFCNLVSPCI